MGCFANRLRNTFINIILKCYSFSDSDSDSDLLNKLGEYVQSKTVIENVAT